MFICNALRIPTLLSGWENVIHLRDFEVIVTFLIKSQGTRLVLKGLYFLDEIM